MGNLTACCACLCENADIFRQCESLEMQTNLYVTQWPARSTPQSKLFSPYTSQPSAVSVCSQIMLSELINRDACPWSHLIPIHPLLKPPCLPE